MDYACAELTRALLPALAESIVVDSITIDPNTGLGFGEVTIGVDGVEGVDPLLIDEHMIARRRDGSIVGRVESIDPFTITPVGYAPRVECVVGVDVGAEGSDATGIVVLERGSDGALFVNPDALPSGGTFSNLLTEAKAPTVDELRDMLTKVMAPGPIVPVPPAPMPPWARRNR